MPDLDLLFFLIMLSVKWRHLETMKPPKNLAYPKSRGKIMVMVFLNSVSPAEFDSNIAKKFIAPYGIFNSPHPDVGSLFMYWDRGGAHSQIAPLCPEAMAMAQLSGI